ncbi:uncharacterized protein LOC109950979 [Corvus cornix cornix]|uniref:uncharacterized protein LOC109950979 n=1 Tax=Corvus cornix cornix TaxID=932674 RepID=UPI00194EEF9E|nr:uncharacterized protein LOC109950979 [Corvus cornix cornix]
MATSVPLKKAFEKKTRYLAVNYGASCNKTDFQAPQLWVPRWLRRCSCRAAVPAARGCARGTPSPAASCVCQCSGLIHHHHPSPIPLRPGQPPRGTGTEQGSAGLLRKLAACGSGAAWISTGDSRAGQAEMQEMSCRFTRTAPCGCGMCRTTASLHCRRGVLTCSVLLSCRHGPSSFWEQGWPSLLLASHTCSLDNWTASVPVAASTRPLPASYPWNKHVFLLLS